MAKLIDEAPVHMLGHRSLTRDVEILRRATVNASERRNRNVAALSILYLVFVYAGVFSFLSIKGTGIAVLSLPIAACLTVGALMDPVLLRRFACVAPYVAWATFYYVYGAYVSSMPGDLFLASMLRVATIPAIAMLVISATRDRKHLQLLASGMQIAALSNAIVAALQTLYPRVSAFTTIDRYVIRAHAADIAQFRAAGLWGNANQAAFFFIVALIMSFWARGPLRWIGAASAVAGCFLTVSRTGAYIICALLLLMGIRWLSGWAQSPGRKLGVLVALPVIALIGALMAFQPISPSSMGTFGSSPTAARLMRLADIGERQSGMSRVQTTSYWMERALDGPWYGSGLYSYMDPEGAQQIHNVGAHNEYICVLGETGWPGLVLFLLMLGYGLIEALGLPPGSNDRWWMVLFWASWLAIAMTWHNMFSTPPADVVWPLLFAIPCVLASSRQPVAEAGPSQRGAAA